MAIVDVERAYVKCLAKAPLTLSEINELKVMGAGELLEMGSIAEAAFVRVWVRHESYRHRAQDLMDGRDPQDDGTGFAKAPPRTWPFYESD